MAHQQVPLPWSFLLIWNMVPCTFRKSSSFSLLSPCWLYSIFLPVFFFFFFSFSSFLKTLKDLESSLAQVSYFSFGNDKTRSALAYRKGLVIKSSSFVARAAHADNQKLSLFGTQIKPQWGISMVTLPVLKWLGIKETLNNKLSNECNVLACSWVEYVLRNLQSCVMSAPMNE